MGKITLLTGGVRSGKSNYALTCARNISGPKAFIATAVPFDNEMLQRVAKHQAERGNDFVTIEEPYELHTAINKIDEHVTGVVIDCMTVWLGNLFYKYENAIPSIDSQVDLFIKAISESDKLFFIVTNEVGWGIVPDNELSRSFRDYNGLLNQKIASFADEVFLCVSGIQIKIKG